MALTIDPNLPPAERALHQLADAALRRCTLTDDPHVSLFWLLGYCIPEMAHGEIKEHLERRRLAPEDDS